MLLFVLIFPFICSFIGYVIGFKSEKWRNYFNILVTGINFIFVCALYKVVMVEPIDISVQHIMGTGLHLRLDVFRYIFLWITSLVWFLSIIYSTRYLIRYKHRNRYYFFFMLTLASTIGIFISENLLNLFTFFEIMSLTSYALIIHDEDDYAHEAGGTYIVMAVGGGLVLLMGLFLLFNYTQTLEISDLYFRVTNLGPIKYVISGLIIIGFGVKAGMMPLHIWLVKAHPAAPAPASAVLSGILLKTGIFGIMVTIDLMLRGDFYTSVVIIVIGFMNMFFGGFFAMFQRNIKRILAYSSMSQVGYILVGVGLSDILNHHGAIAIYGTLFHIINHAIFKVLLFMTAGIIYIATHELSINKISGYGRDKWPLKIFFAIGLFAIIGMPGFNGFVSKTLLHEALAKAHSLYHSNLFTVGEIIFTLSSSFTVAYLLKIFIAVFIEESDNDFEYVKYKPSKATIFPLSVLSFLVIYLGVRPDFIIQILRKTLETFFNNYHLEVHVFTQANIMNSITTIILGVLIYVFFIRKFLRIGNGKSSYYINPAIKWFNIENHLYKPILKVIYSIGLILFRFIDGALVGIAYYTGKTVDTISHKEVKFMGEIIKSSKNLFSHKTDTVKQDKKDTSKEIKKPLDEIIDTANSIPDWINDKAKNDETIHSIKSVISGIYGKMDSITYSVFIFIFVLVILLLILML